MLYLGMMSGTSLDGLDLALCRFTAGRYQILLSETVAYSAAWEKRLRHAADLPGLDLMRLDRELGTYFGQQAAAFLKRTGVEEEIWLCSHGHTVFHAPGQGLTVQIGHGPSMREAAGCPVLSDFRSGDVAAGGQGAPLVPIAERDLFGAYDGCLNLGGFANITFLADTVTAFDICACNTVLNDLANRLGLAYDTGGAIAASGYEIPEMRDALMRLPFYARQAPKSLGREFVRDEVEPFMARHTEKFEDLLCTYTRHIAWAVGQAVGTLPKGASVLVTGGGAFNTYLVASIRTAAPQVKFTVPDAQTVSFKEAVAFAYLGHLHHLGRPGNIPSVTGAREERILGTLCP